jgi:nucleotide-binding universal stress UspA family protein
VPKKILCAIDVNHSGEEILAWASELASSLEADIEIVYAEPRFVSFGEEYYSSKFYFRIMAAASQKAEEMQQRSGTHAQVHIEPGHISDAVVKTAERLHADLVVIGRGSTMAAGRFGLNTYGIIRYSKCPVISVPSDDSAARSPIHRRVQVRQPDGGFHQTDPRWSPMAHPARPPLQDASRRSRPGLSNTRNQQNSLPEK